MSSENKLNKIDKDVAVIKTDVSYIKKALVDVAEVLKKMDRIEMKVQWLESSLKSFMGSHNKLSSRVNAINRNVAWIIGIGAGLVVVLEFFIK